MNTKTLPIHSMLHLLLCNGRLALESMITEGNKQKRQSQMTLPFPSSNEGRAGSWTYTCSFLNRAVSQIRKVHVCPHFSIKSTLQPEEPKKDDPHKINYESPLTAIPISSFFDKNFKPLGACFGYRRVSLFLAGHFIPAPFLDEFNPLRSRPGFYCPKLHT